MWDISLCSLLQTGFLQCQCRLCGDHRELYLPVPSWFPGVTLRRGYICHIWTSHAFFFCELNKEKYLIIYLFVLFSSAITCKPLLDPEQGSYYCFNPYGSNRFNSSCRFHCELGFQLVGVPQLLCQASGHWNHPVPLCQGMSTNFYKYLAGLNICSPQYM